MQRKLPYYMVYPMPLALDEERIEQRDIEYMKSLYPDVAKRILPYVEEECDRMEYQNSMMYDEYPDRLQLRLMCNRVYDKVKKYEKSFFETGEEGSLLPERACGEQSYRLRDLIEVVMYQELMQRRREERRNRGRFY